MEIGWLIIGFRECRKGNRQYQALSMPAIFDGAGIGLNKWEDYVMAAGQNCWEMMNCGRHEECPAHPDSGRTCFHTSNTLCRGEIQGTYEEKITACRQCQVYKDIMA
jgi:methyl-accepting chemotaxis protein